MFDKKEYNKQYYEKNKEKVLERQNEYCKKNKEKALECRKQYYQNNPLRRVWSAIKQRCYNPKHKFYKDYGDRGITMCSEWLNDYKAFEKWCMNSGYQRGLEVDRIDNNGNYEPNNCKWMPMKEQARNRRTNVYIEKDGKMLTATEYAKMTNTSLSTVLYRIKKLRNKNAI